MLGRMSSTPFPFDAHWEALDPVTRGLAASLWRASLRQHGVLPDDLGAWWHIMGFGGWNGPASRSIEAPASAPTPPRGATARDAQSRLAWLGAAWSLPKPPLQPDANDLLQAWHGHWWPQIHPLMERTQVGWRFRETSDTPHNGAVGVSRGRIPQRRTTPKITAQDIIDRKPIGTGRTPAGYEPKKALRIWTQSMQDAAPAAIDPWKDGLALLNPEHPEQARGVLGRLIRDHGPGLTMAALVALQERPLRPASPVSWVRAWLARQGRGRTDAQGAPEPRGGLVI